ncbi:Uncharacterized protein APZ42_005601, partial [Daphnia magna]
MFLMNFIPTISLLLISSYPTKWWQYKDRWRLLFMEANTLVASFTILWLSGEENKSMV